MQGVFCCLRTFLFLISQPTTTSLPHPNRQLDMRAFQTQRFDEAQGMFAPCAGGVCVLYVCACVCTCTCAYVHVRDVCTLCNCICVPKPLSTVLRLRGLLTLQKDKIIQSHIRTHARTHTHRHTHKHTCKTALP